MPAAISLDVAIDRLLELMPDWQVRLSEPSWIRRWIKASGDSRATAYRMQTQALEIDARLFRSYVETHPEIPHSLMVAAYNAEWGIPCEWTIGPFNSEGKRVAA